MMKHAALAIIGVAFALTVAGCASAPPTPDPISGSAYRSLVRGDFPVLASATDAQLTRLGESGCKSMTATDEYGIAGTVDTYASNPNLGLSESEARLLMNYEASAYCPEMLAKLGEK